MITNNSIRSWCDREASLFNFRITQVDELRPNENTLMFVNKDVDIDSIERQSKECVFLLDSHIYKFYKDYPSKFNDLLIVDNPKYVFSYLVAHLGFPSRFQEEKFDNLIGDNCIIDSTAIIGAEDFSPVIGKDRSELIQFPQMGGVSIGDNVLIRHHAIIGKGTFGYTDIGDNTMIDFGCQIGHNCIIGKSCIIAAGTIIGGSTTIGTCTTIGMGARIRNGLHIGKNVSIGMGSVVIHDVPDNCVVVGNPAHIIEHDHIISEKGLV